MRHYTRIILLLLCPLSALFAAKTAVQDVASDGPIKLVPIRTLGLDENGEKIFYTPQDVAVDENGRILVLDNGPKQIHLFSPQGEYQTSLISRGKDKGQLLNPTSLVINRQNQWLIANAGDKRIHRFSSQGAFLEKFKKSIPAGRLHRGPKDQLLVTHPLVTGNIQSEVAYRGDKIKALAGLFTPKGKLITRAGDVKHTKDEMLFRPLNAASCCITPSGAIWIAHQHANRITRYNLQGKSSGQISRDVRYEVVDPEVIKLGPHQYKIRSTSVTVSIGADTQNRLWVAGYARKKTGKDEVDLRIQISAKNEVTITGKEKPAGGPPEELYLLDVFDEKGNPIQQIPMPHIIDQMRVIGDRLFIIDTYWTQCVYEYRIQ